MNSLDTTFSALADPTRRDILRRLALNESSVSQLAAPYQMSLPAISKHLSVLERAGLIERLKDGRVRRCSLNAGPLKAAADWIETYREFWDNQLGSLGDYLNDISKKEESDE